MDEATQGAGKSPDVHFQDDVCSGAELQIEQEKLKLERERMLLERERLEASRERLKIAESAHLGRDGKPSVSVSTLALMSIICLLGGGIMGAFSMSMQRDRRSAERLQEVVRTLAAAAPDGSIGVVTNGILPVAATSMPPWLQAMKPKGAYAGISLVVVQ